MKVRIRKPFKDKHSGRLYHEGEVVIISKERYREIMEGCLLIEEVKDTKPKTTEE